MYRDLKNYSSDSTEYNTLKLNPETHNFILRRNIYLAKKVGDYLLVKLKITTNHKHSPLEPTKRLHKARPRRVVWLWEPEHHETRACRNHSETIYLSDIYG